eukprot:3941749-Rhodomonas_salina.3
MPDTDTAYLPTLCPVLNKHMVQLPYAMTGTEIAYAAACLRDAWYGNSGNFHLPTYTDRY